MGFEQGGERLTRSASEVSDGANSQGTTSTQPTTNEVKTKDHIAIPYTQGLCESIKKICRRYGIQTHFKGNSTIKNLLVSPKDKDPMVNKNGVIYWFQCGDLTCNDEYIGETSRTFGERFKEHLKDSSPIHHHSSNTGHPTTQQNFQIIGREGHGLARNIRESIFIMVNNPTLNKYIGKFNLPHIWDRLLLNTPGLTFKGHAQAVGHANSNQPNIPTHLCHPNSPMQFFTGSEHVHRISQNPYKVQHFSSPSDLMKSSFGWMKACLQQPVFCSRDSTNYYLKFIYFGGSRQLENMHKLTL